MSGAMPQARCPAGTGQAEQASGAGRAGQAVTVAQARPGLTRRAWLPMAGALCGPLLAACDATFGRGTPGAGPKAQGPARVTFWNYGGGGVSDQLFEAVAQEYRKQFPAVTLERTGIPSGEIQDKLVVSWTSDVVPDLVMDSNRGFLRFMDSGWFLDITKEFSTRRLKQSDFYEVPTRAYQIDGKQYGMPQGWGTSLYLLNLDIFERNGVPLAPGFDENWTQDDFVRMLKSVVKYDGQGRHDPVGGCDDSIFFHWLYSYGGDFLSPDKSKAATDSPEALAAAEWYARVHTGERVFMRDGIDKRPELNFNQGTIAATANGIPNGIIDYAKIPARVNVFLKPNAPKGRNHRMYLDGYFIFKDTRARDATVDFLFWLLDEGARVIEENGGNNIPSNKKVAEDVWLKTMTQFNKKRWLEAAATARPDPLHAKWVPDLQTIYSKYSGQLRSAQAGPREAMANMTSDVNAVLDEYRRQRGTK
ncbi:MAG TPA: extracellular solute-binding protein [Chloroflexota bacterium]|nr:extracellular solute-binding protein [Chloroflexota bacterium]